MLISKELKILDSLQVWNKKEVSLTGSLKNTTKNFKQYLYVVNVSLMGNRHIYTEENKKVVFLRKLTENH